MKDKSRRTLGEEIRMICRGYRILSEAVGKAPFILDGITCFLGIVIGYVGIWFSAGIVNELAGNRNMRQVWLLVWLNLGSMLVLALVKAVLNRWSNSLRAESYTRILYRYSAKSMEMDFADIESEKIKKLYADIEGAHRWGGGWGLYYLYWRYQEAVNQLSKVCCSVALTVSLFVLPVSSEKSDFLFLDHPVTKLCMIGWIAFITWINVRLAARAEQEYVQICADEVQALNRKVWHLAARLGYDNHRRADMRMYGQEKFARGSYKHAFSILDVLMKNGAGASYTCNIYTEALLQIFTGLIYIYVCLKALGGAFGVGNIAQYAAALTGLSAGLRGLLTLFGSLKVNNAYLEKTFEYLDYPNAMYQGTLPVEKRRDREYEMEFRNVSFRYPGTESYVLKDVNLKFKIGERLAVVGMNGSGKTTFIKLMCRLYDPTDGQILLNGIDIRKYDYREYMDIFAIVFQDFKVFSFSLGQNVAASMTYDNEFAEKCLGEAGFGERLNSLTDGLETYLFRDFEKGGVELSGGEAQKVALARALYKNAPFIILDEPTAALDPIAEYEIYSKFNEIVGDKTAIYISHRLSSCRFCDNIAVFDNGCIVQKGSHEELVKVSEGKYYELWNAQAQYYVSGA